MSAFVELCCGSAALTVRLLGGKKPPAPYQGAKTGYAEDLMHALQLGGRAFDEILLVDAGPWATVWSVLIQDRWAVAEHLRARVERGESLFNAMGASTAPEGSIEWAAAFLVLQTGCYRSKPVMWADGAWRHAGYAHLSTSSRSRGFRTRVNAGRVADRLERLPDLSRVRVVHGDALAVDPRPGVVYLDPPYQGRHGYGSIDLSREDVLRLAARWDEAGAAVGISEAEPIDVPGGGWQSIGLQRAGVWQPRNFGKIDEWLTVNRPVAARRRPEQLELFG